VRVPWYLDPRMPMELRERRNRVREAAACKVAFHVPRSVAYWCAIRVMVNATNGAYSNQVVPDLLAIDALERWDKS
jgi:hypothetical protein